MAAPVIPATALLGPAQYSYDAQGNVIGVVNSDGTVTNLRASNLGPISKVAFAGDSITAQGSSDRGANLVPSGVFINSLGPSLTNIGSTFVVSVGVDGRCQSGAGSLTYNGPFMSWAAPGESAGAPVDVTNGGFFYLPSSVANHGLIVAVRWRNRPLLGPYTDSVTVASTQFFSPRALLRGFQTWADMLLGKQLVAAYNFGITGDTTVDLLARFAQVLASDADTVHILIGTNDIDGTTAATAAASAVIVKANIVNMVAQCVAAGKRVILGAILANTSGSTFKRAAIVDINCTLERFARANGIDFADYHAVTADPSSSTGAALADRLNTDGLHPSQKGAYCMGKLLRAILNSKHRNITGRARSAITYDAVVAKQGNLLTNGLFIGTGGSAGTGVTGSVPAGVTLTRGGSTMTIVSTAPSDASPIARTDGIPGNWWRTVITGATGDFAQFFPNAVVSAANFSAGDVVEMVGEVRIQGTGIRTINITFNHSTPSNTVFALSGDSSDATNALGNMDGDAPIIPFRSEPYIIPAGATNMTVGFVIYVDTGGSATIDFANFALRKIV